MQVMNENDPSAAPAKKRTERTCAGCGKHAAPEVLVRVVHDPGTGALAVDMAGSGFGRGAHVHPAKDCLTKALKSGFARVFTPGTTKHGKMKISGEVEELGAQIVAAADRRIEGLLSGAKRAGQLAVGSDVVVEALRSERAELVIVAMDAAAAAKLGGVERAVADGKAIAFSQKKRLGTLMNRDEVAVIAILHRGVASAVAQSHLMSGPFRGGTGAAVPTDVRSEEAWSSSPEVR